MNGDRKTIVVRPDLLQPAEVEELLAAEKHLQTLQSLSRALKPDGCVDIGAVMLKAVQYALKANSYISAFSYVYRQHDPMFAHRALAIPAGEPLPVKGPVTQQWTWGLPFMQQTVLISAIRGCDGMAKYHAYKPLVRWLRRCILKSAFENVSFDRPCAPGGGSFTGPVAVYDLDRKPSLDNDDAVRKWEQECLGVAVGNFMNSRDELPMHYSEHIMHAAQILGYKHPDFDIANFWKSFYHRMVAAKHLMPEPEEDMDMRLGDTKEGWAVRVDAAELKAADLS